MKFKRKKQPKKIKKQSTFFNIPTWQEDEWQGMPEFAQEDQSPYKTLFVHFESREDVDAFAKLVDQKIAAKTKFIWYPKVETYSRFSKRYVDTKDKDES